LPRIKIENQECSPALHRRKERKDYSHAKYAATVAAAGERGGKKNSLYRGEKGTEEKGKGCLLKREEKESWVF